MVACYASRKYFYNDKVFLLKDLRKYKSTNPEEHLHARTSHKEEKTKKRQEFGFENMEEYIIKMKEWMNFTIDQRL